ncbi:MAG TPA: MerR family transcriptional regulator [Spirochaetia bacterium]|nr:MerR family transcriptional regulator [Spirochaetia bacterium]
MGYSVKDIATMAGVSVRTIHHYDHIGLLKPQDVTGAGYRLYGDEELNRLQQILFYRELGFALSEIKATLDRPDFDRVGSLESHRAALIARRRRLGTLIATIDRTVASLKGETVVEKHRLFEGFDVEAILGEQEEYTAEVDAKYDPALVAESRRKTARYTKAEWGRILREGTELRLAMSELLAAGAKPDDPGMQDLVQRHHMYINDRFYTCSIPVYRGLGELYVNDPRFAANFEKAGRGLARFVSDAIRIYTSKQ